MAGLRTAAWVDGNLIHPRCGASYPEETRDKAAQLYAATLWQPLEVGRQRLAIRNYALLRGYPLVSLKEEVVPAEEAVLLWPDFKPGEVPGCDTVDLAGVRRLAEEARLNVYDLRNMHTRQQLLACVRTE